MLMFFVQFFLVLAAILLGIRRGGLALGMIGGLGVAVLVFIFRVQPSEPPIQVMLIILAVVTSSAALQVAGGLDYLVQLTERLLRAHPNRVTLLAPLCSFFLTVCVGTGHAVYALFPVIADVAWRTRIRPERPMAISSVAAQMGITASPVAAAVTTFLAYSIKMGTPVTIFDIVKITLPAGVVGVLAAALWSVKRGKDLDKDPEFQERMKDPAFREQLDISVVTRRHQAEHQCCGQTERDAEWHHYRQRLVSESQRQSHIYWRSWHSGSKNVKVAIRANVGSFSRLRPDACNHHLTVQLMVVENSPEKHA
jgi:anaerobic C4-dicarboxylate transporter DcuB